MTRTRPLTQHDMLSPVKKIDDCVTIIKQHLESNPTIDISIASGFIEVYNQLYKLNDNIIDQSVAYENNLKYSRLMAEQLAAAYNLTIHPEIPQKEDVLEMLLELNKSFTKLYTELSQNTRSVELVQSIYQQTFAILRSYKTLCDKLELESLTEKVSN